MTRGKTAMWRCPTKLQQILGIVPFLTAVLRGLPLNFSELLKLILELAWVLDKVERVSAVCSVEMVTIGNLKMPLAFFRFSAKDDRAVRHVTSDDYPS